jgi:hypothetical protein
MMLVETIRLRTMILIVLETNEDVSNERGEKASQKEIVISEVVLGWTASESWRLASLVGWMRFS